ncbi:hypothetical protein fHyEco03_gp03R [Escherichia phage vB_EcoM_fHy-Eco03]|nr:hypothetical protein fHyEco03_gp03L [Escherichia phage vB_EcoM_fHy-Eco03]QTD79444.1 hypothetical protein fHyEco03_gp03R [Escherichia phage vB_EcoM_fHy-Eco03]
MIGLILATCVATHDCSYKIIESKTEWTTIEQCVADSPYTLLELGFVPAQNQRVICDELKQD